MGILGTTNAIIRHDLWHKHHFNKEFVHGGEDGEWARHFFNQGFVVIHDPKFTVYHSHKLHFLDLIKQFLKWRKMSEPREPFK
ncbi:MAG: hypothetical protein Q7R97_03385 [Candidatus Daviesbacteria bacterium]|nr:hypothetical protein [Candidatus Daviesbacteria bacterium]